MLDTTEGKMSAFAHQVGVQSGKGISTSTAVDWEADGEQIVEDLLTAIAHPF